MMGMRSLLVAGIVVLGVFSSRGDDPSRASWDDTGKIMVEIAGTLGSIQNSPAPDKETPKQVWASVHVPGKELSLDCTNAPEVRKALIAEMGRSGSNPGIPKPILVKGTLEFRRVKGPAAASTTTSLENAANSPPENPPKTAPMKLDVEEAMEPVVLVESLSMEGVPAKPGEIKVIVTGLQKGYSFSPEPQSEVPKNVWAHVRAAGKEFWVDCSKSIEARKAFFNQFPPRNNSEFTSPKKLEIKGTMEFRPKERMLLPAAESQSEASPKTAEGDPANPTPMVAKTEENTEPVIVVEDLSIHRGPGKFSRPIVR